MGTIEKRICELEARSVSVKDQLILVVCFSKPGEPEREVRAVRIGQTIHQRLDDESEDAFIDRLPRTGAVTMAVEVVDEV